MAFIEKLLERFKAWLFNDHYDPVGSRRWLRYFGKRLHLGISEKRGFDRICVGTSIWGKIR